MHPSPASPPSDPRQNHLLAALSDDVQARLFPQLEITELPLRSLMYEAGSPMRHVYFPADAIVSLQYLLESGASTAIAIVGHEGLLGTHLLLGGGSTPNRAVVQCAGHAYRLPAAHAREEFGRHGELTSLVLRYTQALMVQVAQTAVCNRHHSIDQQLCRWLLMSLDRVAHDSVTMTQEFLANVLGVRRAGITAAARKLEERGAISYGRGVIHVEDRAELQRLSCECYRVVRKETELLLNYLPNNADGFALEDRPGGA